MRTVLPINSSWSFVAQWDDKYITKAMPHNSVDIPHTTMQIPLNNFDESSYMLHCGYQRTVDITSDMLAGSIYIHFEAVAHRAIVYCNGTKVASHSGGYTAFDADISSVARQGANTITVEVDCREDNDIPPFSGVIDYLCFGGIYREVQLIAVPSQHITQLHVDGNHLGVLNVSITLADSQATSVLLEVCDCNGNSIYTSTIDVQGTASHSTTLSDIVAWDTDNPALYTISATIEGDVMVDRFGFRTALFTNRGFYLNGKLTKLLGLNRHQSYPYVGYAMPRALQEQDADKVKASGCNIVRQSHYPQSRHFNNRCDEIGLLVFCEAPGWQSIGDDTFRDNYIMSVGEMICEHYNHPSIVVWGVRVNESQDCDTLYAKTNQLAHQLDSSRQTTGVRFIKKSRLLEDVYSYNDFVHSGNNAGTTAKRQVCGNVPLLITEHNGHMFPCKPYDHIQRRIDQCLRHAKVIDSALGSSAHCGVIGWCLADYNTHIQFGSGDRICYHGVTDMFRCDKIAQGLYASQGSTEPVLQILSSADLGDYSAMVRNEIIVASNCDYITVSNNGRVVDTFYPAKKQYPHLPHPPYVIPHLLNGEVERIYGYNAREGKRILRALIAGVQGMQDVALRAMAPIQIKYRQPMSYWQDMAIRVVNRNGESDNYVFDGYTNGVKVISKAFGSSNNVAMHISTATPVVTLHDTYEIAQVDVCMLDSNGNICTYCDDVVTLAVDGADVVYSNTGSLIGGRRSFYIRSNKATTATVTASNNRGQICNIDIHFAL